MALPIFAELVLDGAEALGAGSIVHGVYEHFKEPVKKLVTDEAGKLVGNYARNNPGGIVDMSLESASTYRKMGPPRKPPRRTCR
jgi:hypothetical protein